MPELSDVAALIDQWPSLAEFARDAGVSYGAAKQMRRRGSIAVVYWRSLLACSVGRDLGLNSDTLVALHNADSRRVDATGAAA